MIIPVFAFSGILFDQRFYSISESQTYKNNSHAINQSGCIKGNYVFISNTDHFVITFVQCERTE